jgi:hypothetical protein
MAVFGEHESQRTSRSTGARMAEPTRRARVLALRKGAADVMLPFSRGLMQTNHMDAEMSVLADRHYSRRKVGARQFCNSGRKLVLRNAEGTVLFVWMWVNPAYRMDDQVGFNCAIFRNESRRRASDIILEAERFAVAKWGSGRAFTFIDTRKIRLIKRRSVAVPGFCFIAAGWRNAGISAKGKLILEKEL